MNKIENRITFKIKTEYYLESLMSETMNLPETTKIKITKDENGQNVPRLKLIEVVLVHCNIVYNNYQQDSRIFYIFAPNKSFGQLLDSSLKILYFKNLLTQNVHILKYGLLVKIINH